MTWRVNKVKRHWQHWVGKASGITDTRRDPEFALECRERCRLVCALLAVVLGQRSGDALVVGCRVLVVEPGGEGDRGEDA